MEKLKSLAKGIFHPSEYPRLYRENKEICNYIIFGVLTTVVSYLSYYLARFLFPDASSVPAFLRFLFDITAFLGTESATVLPVIISWIISVTFAYITNRLWVFESRAHGFLKILREVGSFYLARIITLLADILIMFLLVDLPQIYSPVYEFFAKAISSVVVLTLNYVFSKLFVFRSKSVKTAEKTIDE